MQPMWPTVCKLLVRRTARTMYSRRRGAQVASIDAGAAADAAADAARDIAESQPVEDDPRLVRVPRALCISVSWLHFC